MITIPESFVRAPFYSSVTTVETPKGPLDTELSKQGPYFAHDIAYVQQVSVEQPWSNPYPTFKYIQNQWKEIGYPLITERFSERDRKGAEPYMVKYTALFIQLLHWSQATPVRSLIQIEKMLANNKVAPLNVTDRLGFILQMPNHHHAFTTLTELYREAEKKIAIELAKK
ncbi:YpoC family protein [Texcoconibacillus texcoconensis]|uniref:YpoC-like domain-containing protein n=1 Tax=Texcoconibacillus texcoconensis TaxID=1095777 RepID=A0A840QQF4_9BACI|nr:hypothetical protein [Texcoconibacillus texcoconensis]MBB5173590.1 hypothetical protein [Texcoconibacillus texcoconensis]